MRNLLFTLPKRRGCPTPSRAAGEAPGLIRRQKERPRACVVFWKGRWGRGKGFGLANLSNVACLWTTGLVSSLIAALGESGQRSISLAHEGFKGELEITEEVGTWTQDWLVCI